ncbi:DUF433 domain-containing protein [Dyadobacter sp. SG02]|uniref:DUF433 domain-containing protein n=1 Tax=Dyadobacter sp. SG02 TaxID=1855291 RepID=UPI0015A57772|nr:DUF433 domain-containing protein [Dyadobacter sp. SG02]
MKPFETQSLVGVGTGIYTLPDIAEILHLPAVRVRRWMHEYWQLRFSSSAESEFSHGSGKELVTNFLTLIEFFTFYQLRQEGVSAQKIVKAHQILSKAFRTKYPFAKSNLLTDGKQILFSGEVGEIIRADETLQITIKEAFAPFCKKVEFNEDNVVKRFYPMGREHSIVVDPRRQFGQPVIGDTNVLAETVYRLHRGGESVEMITSLYALTVEQVNDAINYYRKAA